MSKKHSQISFATIIAAYILGMFLTWLITTILVEHFIPTAEPPAQVTVQKTRDDYWQECMNKYDNEPGNYMQACFYSAIDSCKAHGCVVDPLLEEKK